MTQAVDRLSRAHTNIVLLLKDMAAGTKTEPRRGKVIDLALERAEAWALLPVQAVWIRGGSTSPEADAERKEVQRVIRMAVEAASDLPALLKQIEDMTWEAYGIVQRLTAVVDPAKYDVPVEPGCASCERTEGKDAARIGGHWALIYEKSQAVGLCRWCYDFTSTRAGELDTDLGDKKAWPPVRACHLLHTQSARAAGVWLTKLKTKVA